MAGVLLPPELKRERDVIVHRIVHEVRAGEKISHRAAQRRPAGRRKGVPAGYFEQAGLRLLQQAEHIEQGCLAGPVRAYNGEDLPLFYLERVYLQGETRRQVQGQVPELYHSARAFCCCMKVSDIFIRKVRDRSIKPRAMAVSK